MQFKGNTDEGSARYWDDLAEVYQKETRISTTDFHYGPLLPGDSTLQLLPSIGKNDPKSFQGSEKNMPAGSSGFQALEIGSGAGQNSIFLAKQGAECVAIDISKEQLAHGRKLAKAENVEVDFQCVSMDSLKDLQYPPRPAGTPPKEGVLKAPLHGRGGRSNAMGGVGLFDLIHSTYALPFSSDPARVIKEASAMLKPDGTFLLTTGHPLYAGEWLEVGPAGDGGRVLIIEGLHVFYSPAVRELLDLKVFVDTGRAVCLGRRLERDVRERGRTPESVVSRFQRHVVPMYEEYIEPVRRYADIVVNGERPIEESIAAVLARVYPEK